MSRFLKKCSALLLSSLVLLPAAAVGAYATEPNETYVVSVDSVNGTRWEDTMVVYKDRATTLQNQYGWNVVVDASGVVTNMIEGGDMLGKNLAIPEGGFVLSGTGDAAKEMYSHISIGENAMFDEYGMRVLVSKGEINAFYEYSFDITAFNAVRYADTIVIYNKQGSTTGTNGYGYEVCVNKDGLVISAGGNDSAVPDGGYVISAISSEDKQMLKAYCIPGSRCELSGKTVNVSYTADMLVATVQNELENAKAEVETAKEQLRLVDYDAIADAIASIDPSQATDLASRGALLDRINDVIISLTETRTVEVRGTWYVPTEVFAEDLTQSIKEMADAGLNQLCLSITSSGKSIVDAPGVGLYKADARLTRFDVMQTVVDACKEYDIELIAVVPVFHGGENAGFAKYYTKTNNGTANDEHFASPANDEYMAEFTEFVRYIVTHYDIDGLQYDYIRYPYFDGTTDYGYDDATKTLFAKETGLPESTVDEIAKQLTSHKNWNDWLEFKISLIDRRVKELSAVVRELRPDIYISAAVANDDSPSSYCQVSKHWLDDGDVDGIYPMSYSEGIFEMASKNFSAYMTDKSFLVMGNGAYQSFTLKEMYLQNKQQALFGSDGIAYFEWGAYVDHGYSSAFADTVYKDSKADGKALSFTYKESESIAALKDTAVKRYELYCELNGVAKAELNADMSLDEMQGVLEQYGNAYLMQDIKLAMRVQKMSKEEYKQNDYLVKDESSDDVSSGETSSDDDDSAEPDGSSEPDRHSSSGNALPWIIGGAVAAAAICAAVVIISKKRKQK